MQVFLLSSQEHCQIQKIYLNGNDRNSCTRFLYNSLLFGLAKKLLSKLQSVQNAAARIINLSRKNEHLTPILVTLHWLPIESRINFKILMLTYKALLHHPTPKNSFLYISLVVVIHIISSHMVIVVSP